MAHNLDFSTGKAGFAFTGDRADIWHRLGTQMTDGMSVTEWARAAGLDWTAEHCDAVANLRGEAFDHIAPDQRMSLVPNFNFVVRSDTGHVLGWGTDRRREVQPREVLEWFDRYIQHDDRFALDAAGSLGHGEKIWATATFKDDITVAGDTMKGRLLMTTAYDGSMSTINKATTVRVVCNNTFDASMVDRRSEVRTRHNTSFNHEQVGRELARIAQGFSTFKAVGDALAANHMAGDEVSRFFKTLLDIPFNPETGHTKEDEVSTRKQNQFADMRTAYAKTATETEKGTAWCAFNAVTRYVDHDRSTRKTGEASEAEAQFASAQFGSGASMKAQAMALLMPRVKDKVLIAA
jgi:phage/plasmid-like protein (TIGR03299 family)